METSCGLSLNARFHRQGQDLLNSRPPPQRPHREVPLLMNPVTYLTTAACGFGSPCPRGAPVCNFPARSPEGAGPTSSAPAWEGWSADEPISWAGFWTRGPAPAQPEPLSALALGAITWAGGMATATKREVAAFAFPRQARGRDPDWLSTGCVPQDSPPPRPAAAPGPPGAFLGPADPERGVQPVDTCFRMLKTKLR